jgi:hypothetical protein
MPGGNHVSASQEIPEEMPQHASYWYRRWLVAQEGLDEEAAQGIAQRGNWDLMHADLGDLLEACGMGNFARPQSSHEVMQEAVAKVRTLTVRPLVLVWRDERGTEICRSTPVMPGTVKIGVPLDAQSADLIREGS